MSLYLKYRPKSFADVVGQDHIVTTLEHAVQRDQLVHAYLFFGPRGTGKTSVARILAKILLIRKVDDESLQKHIIQSVDDGTLVDLIEIDAATNRKIDDVRDLKEKVQFVPSVASAKVYIIDEVHMMTREAFDALLKTLEEPPDHAFFILATTELHKVPDTIQSRCQRFSFHRIGEKDIVRRLQNIADKERIKASRGALRAIARHVNGGMRDAISVLDQLSSLEEITEEDIRLRIGESAEEYVEQIWEAVDAGDCQTALAIAGSLQEKGISLEVFLRQLLRRARTQLHESIEEQADTAPALARIAAIFQALKDLRVSPVPSVALEVALVELCGDTLQQAQGSLSVQAVKGKVKKEKKKEKTEKEEKEEKEEGVSLKVEGDLSSEVLAKEDATVVAKDITREAVLEVWDDVVAAVQPASVRMSLMGASIEEVASECITLAFSSKFHRDKVAATKASREVVRILKEHFHQPVQIECVLRTGAESEPVETAEEAVNMAEAVAEIFGK